MKWRKLHLLVCTSKDKRLVRLEDEERKKNCIMPPSNPHVDQKAELKACSYLSWLHLIIYFMMMMMVRSLRFYTRKAPWSQGFYTTQISREITLDAL